MKSCPYCGERIQDAALKCRYCGEWFPPHGPGQGADPATQAPPEQRNPAPTHTYNSPASVGGTHGYGRDELPPSPELPMANSGTTQRWQPTGNGHELGPGGLNRPRGTLHPQPRRPKAPMVITPVHAVQPEPPTASNADSGLHYGSEEALIPNLRAPATTANHSGDARAPRNARTLPDHPPVERFSSQQHVPATAASPEANGRRRRPHPTQLSKPPQPVVPQPDTSRSSDIFTTQVITSGVWQSNGEDFADDPQPTAAPIPSTSATPTYVVEPEPQSEAIPRAEVVVDYPPATTEQSVDPGLRTHELDHPSTRPTPEDGLPRADLPLPHVAPQETPAPSDLLPGSYPAATPDLDPGLTAQLDSAACVPDEAPKAPEAAPDRTEGNLAQRSPEPNNAELEPGTWARRVTDPQADPQFEREQTGVYERRELDEPATTRAPGDDADRRPTAPELGAIDRADAEAFAAAQLQSVPAVTPAQAQASPIQPNSTYPIQDAPLGPPSTDMADMSDADDDFARAGFDDLDDLGHDDFGMPGEEDLDSFDGMIDPPPRGRWIGPVLVGAVGALALFGYARFTGIDLPNLLRRGLGQDAAPATDMAAVKGEPTNPPSAASPGARPQAAARAGVGPQPTPVQSNTPDAAEPTAPAAAELQPALPGKSNAQNQRLSAQLEAELDSARTNFKRGKTKAAAASLTSILSQVPKHPEALELMTQVEIGRNNVEAARRLAGRCVAVDKNRASCWMTIASLADARDEKDTVIEAWKNYLRLEPQGKYRHVAQRSLKKLQR